MGPEGRARLGLAFLLSITLFSFGEVFAEGDYPGPTMLGMLLALGIVLLARRMGLGTSLTLLASAAGLAVYLVIVFQVHNSFFLLPTPDALTGLARSVARAWDHSRLDYAPIPVRGGYVIALIAGMWTATTIAELATFRWRRPFAAALLPIVLFSLVMVVGTHIAAPLFMALFLTALLTYWGLESSYRLRAWGRWVSAFRDHSEEPESVTGVTARRMGATCVAAALIAPVFLPAIGEGLLQWRSGIGLGGPGSGGGAGGRIDPLVSIAPRIIENSDREMFFVGAPQRSYWRLVSLVDFDGETWRPADATTRAITTGSLDTEVPVSPGSETGDFIFQLRGLKGDYLPTLKTATATTFDDFFRHNVRVDPQTGDLSYVGGIGDTTFDYTVTAAVPSFSYDELIEAEIGSLDEAYTRVPELSPEVTALRDAWVAGAASPFLELVAIQQELRTGFTYSLDPAQITGNQEASADLLSNFLLTTRTGYCQQFATAFAALARSLGYPTRVAVGFLPGAREPDAGPNVYVVRGTDAHAWPEVFFEDHGWVAFEPTPRSFDRLAPQPIYTSPDTFDNGGQSLGFGDGSRGLGGGGLFAPGQDPSRPVLNRLGRGDGGPALSQPAPLPPGERVARDPAWTKTFATLARVSIAAVIMFLLGVPLLKEWRVRYGYRRAGDPRSLTTAAFSEFVLEAAEMAPARRPAESAVSYARRVVTQRGLPQGPTLRLAGLYEAAQYAPAAPSSHEAADARRLARELRGYLWQGATWWERGLRLFAPRNLLPAGRV